MLGALDERVRDVRERIGAACARASRDPGSVTLVAAVKGVPADLIEGAGIRDVGENRVQDLLAKQQALGHLDLRWHFIGVLQRNKARKITGKVALIHSIDSIELIEAIARAARESSVTQAILIEVNTSGEPSKAGCRPRDLPALVAHARSTSGIDLRGLMTVPAVSSVEPARGSFRMLADLAGEHSLPELSMGMSDDFEIAIEEGATFVRVGTTLFGRRKV